MSKESSYQRLKRKLRKAEKELWRIKCAIADKNEEVLSAVSIEVHMTRQSEKILWFGESTGMSKTKMKTEGIFNLIHKQNEQNA